MQTLFLDSQQPEEQFAAGRATHSGGSGERALSVRLTRIPKAHPDLAMTWGGVDGSLIRVTLRPQPITKVQQGRNCVSVRPRTALETSLWNVREPCVWDMVHPIDQVVFDLSAAAVAQWSGDTARGRRLLPDVASGSVLTDATLQAFGLAILPILEAKTPPGQFFIDHVLNGVCTYLSDRFGSDMLVRRGGLAPWQERRAKEIMDACRGTDASLADLAAACGLSVAHFSRAFRQSCGLTPHAWLTARRIERAKLLLKTTETPLSIIAVDCGFVDQSHMTNVFKRHLGSPPGAMRRYWRSGVSEVGDASSSQLRSVVT